LLRKNELRMNPYLSHIAFLTWIYVLLLAVYYFSAHAHVTYCTPWGVWGFLRSPFLIETLECRALKWLFNYSHEYIHTLWLFTSTYIVKVIVDFFAQLKDGVHGKMRTPERTSLVD
jgi:hypothetical protein